ncbi:MAG: BON domain-containing protein [Rickettsiales bacterium]
MKKYIVGILMLNLAGCAPMVGVSSAIVGTTIAQERTAGDKLDDELIILKIKEAYTQEEFNEMLGRISVNSFENRVLLTGSVRDKKFLDKAVELAWKVRGVKEVLNEIIVSQKEFKDHAQDALIANTIRSKYLLEKDFDSLNYTVDVNEGAVYLLGVSQTALESRKAIEIARSVKGVIQVVNYVIPKDDPRRKGYMPVSRD